MKARSDRERLQQVVLEQEEFLGSVRSILMEEQSRDAILRALVLSSNGPRMSRIDGLDPRRIFHVQAIRAMCIKYRLRFLDAQRFKGPIPNPAVYEMRRLEERAHGPLGGFKIMAPARLFRLCDSEADPLLFVRIGRDTYYLVHKWGGDLHPLRPLLYWPVRSWAHLAITVFLLAAVVAALIPSGLIAADANASWLGLHRLLFLFWIEMVCASFTVFGWFAFFGQFSREAWNSRHFN